MLTEEENELLTRIGPGTRCGELLRRYWHPVAMASELTDARPKMRLTVLGEELVLFRMRNAELGMGNAEAVPEGDSAIRTPHSAIRYGLLGEHCSHRGASLYYGFLEDGGLRCPYRS